MGGTADDAVCTTYKNKNSAAVLSDTQAIWVPTGGIMGLAKGSVSLSEDVNLGDLSRVMSFADIDSDGLSGFAIGCISYNYTAPVSITDSVFGGNFIFKGGNSSQTVTGSAATANIPAGGGWIVRLQKQTAIYTKRKQGRKC